MKATIFYGFICFAAGVVLMTGCSPKPTPATKGEFFISLVDSPAAFKEVNIELTGVAIHSLGADSLSGWTLINNSQSTYNLLALRNGINAILCDTILPPGTFDKIRLSIGDGSNIVIDSIIEILDISDADTVTLSHAIDIQAGGFFAITIDFDANRSIVQISENQFKLEPVIRVVTNSSAGTISGMVVPPSAIATVITTTGAADTIVSYCDSISGHFVLVALPIGTYRTTIIPGDTSYQDTTFTNIPVTPLHDSNLGTITLRPK